MGIIAMIKQVVQIIIAVIILGGFLVAMGTMFPDGELGAGIGELVEGITSLLSEAADSMDDPV